MRQESQASNIPSQQITRTNSMPDLSQNQNKMRPSNFGGRDIFQTTFEIMEALDEALEELKASGEDAAVADNTMRREKAKAFLKVRGNNAQEREANADYMWADAREKASLAESRRETALEVVRSYRQKLSALQSVMSAMKSEADALKYGQTVGA